MQLSILPLVIGAGLCYLKRWAWIWACLGTALVILLGLVRFPQGIVDILIHSALLRFLLGSGPRKVFNSDYREIVRLTPLMQSRPAPWIHKLIATFIVLLMLAYVVIRL